jgi:predicted NBD/HSP70 family sugar kinase
LSWGSCSEIISLLCREGMIRVRKTTGHHDGRPGRRASGYEFTRLKFLLAGMELKARSIDCSLVNLGGIELNRKEYSLPDKPTNENIFKQISAVYINFLVDSGIKPNTLLGLSISLTGAVDPLKKRLIFSPRYDSLEEMDFSMLQELLPQIEYFSVDHDINAQSSSVMDKNGWKESNYAFVHCGEGVGMGFYNKEIYTGSRGFAGEIGHVPYPGLKGNRKCPCGKMNCYETVLSNKGIKDLIREITGIDRVDLSDLDQSLRTDPTLSRIIAEAIRY